VLPPFLSLPKTIPRAHRQGQLRGTAEPPPQRPQIVTAVVTDAVHEERRRAVHAAANGAEEVLPHVRGVPVLRKVRRERLELQPERTRRREQVLRGQPVLMLEEHVVHLPKAALGTRRLGGLGGLERVQVDPTQREVAKGEPKIVAQRLLQPLHDRICRTAVRALEVAVLDDRDGRRLGAADMVPIADRDGEPWRRHQRAHATLIPVLPRAALSFARARRGCPRLRG
jgi:hypothetical protein